MATQTQTTGSGLARYRLTVDQYKRMIDRGIFPDGARVELLDGRLIERITRGTPHNYLVSQLADLLRTLVAPGLLVSEEKSLQLDRWSRPEPDIVVIRGPRETYRKRDPRAEDAPLVIEVADSTYAKDRGAMWQHYAAAGIPCYWIVNIPERVVEAYGSPLGRGKTAVYHDATTFSENDELPVVIDGVELGRLAVKALFS